MAQPCPEDTQWNESQSLLEMDTNREIKQEPNQKPLDKEHKTESEELILSWEEVRTQALGLHSNRPLTSK